MSLPLLEPAASVPANVTRHCYVRVRHSAKCKDRLREEAKKDPQTGQLRYPEFGVWEKCRCRKWIFFYDASGQSKTPSGTPIKPGVTEKESAKTRVWAEAKAKAQQWLDQFDPDKVRIKQLEAENQRQKIEQELQTVSIEEAVARFLVYKKGNPSRRSSRIAGKTADSTMEAYRILLGDVDPATFELKRRGHLFTWLEKQAPRPTLISDLTPTRVDAFRASWNFPSDLTTATTFTRLKTFFAYCKERGRWIKESPLEGVSRPTVQEGSRTAAFTDEQYKAILDTLAERESAIRKVGTPTEKQSANNKRLLTLVELMRWGGLALHDAVDFKQSSLTGDELRYRRKKTNRWAKPILPLHVVNLLQTVVPINGDPNQPFRDVTVKIGSDKNYWSRQLKELFADAGIKTVTTEIRERDAHAHMLRDSFAVGQLERHIRDGKPSLKSIADAMGDSVPVTLKHYAPIMDKLEKAHAEEQRKVVAAQVAKLTEPTKQAEVVEIGGRRG